jgi:uncharacterized membrane protein
VTAPPSSGAATSSSGSVTSSPSAAPSTFTGPHARRVIFIDLARALAVVFMLYGHTVSAVLAPQYQSGPIFEAWTFQRGLTSSLFLLLSGFAFSIATTRHWASHLRVTPALFRRLRRFGLFVLLGYLLHFPVTQFAHLADMSEERWRSLLAVDVLQLIGVTFIGVQLLVLVTRSRRAFMMTTFALAAAVMLAAPRVWSVPWTEVLPLSLAAYLSPGAGSQFPLFPWAAFVLFGAGLGQIYARWGASHLLRYATGVLLLPGLALLGVSYAMRLVPPAWFGGGSFAFVPREFVLRVGACLLVLAGIAYASRRITHLPHIFGAVAQETLVIYFVHLCIVYGSIWNRGLAQIYGPTLGPGATFLAVVLLMTAMAGLAWYWNWCKHVRPRTARWASLGAGALLIAKLF